MREGNAAPWAKKKTEGFTANNFATATWVQFVQDIRTTFSDANHTDTVQKVIKKVKQTTTVDDFIIRFKEHADDSQFHENTLIDLFKSRLNSGILQKIYSQDQLPTNLDGWKTCAC
jgi:hypothetical protein